ncbi:MAG: formylglycine-generating enzyme family protein [Planctomycetota bacterium]|jgi:formylglycine-generating enzyme required for sulfatase activity
MKYLGVGMTTLGVLLLAGGCKPSEQKEHPPTITTKSGVEMVLIPSGSFLMGDNKGKPDEQPQHPVSVSSFLMDRYEVTQAHYMKTTGTNPSKFGGKNWKVYPVDRIGWQQAAAYCNERSHLEALEPCYDEETWQCNFDASGYRLPTEAEWEYAYRASANTSYDLKQRAWFKENSNGQTHPVGIMKPNRWSLHDMAGNVYEWCDDYYDPNYYQTSPDQDPRGPQEGETRVLRGGCWVTSADTCRPASRFSDDPVNADTCLGYPAYGFRCVRRP